MVCQGVHSVASLDKALSRKGKVQPRKHPTDGTAWVILWHYGRSAPFGVKVKPYGCCYANLDPKPLHTRHFTKTSPALSFKERKFSPCNTTDFDQIHYVIFNVVCPLISFSIATQSETAWGLLCKPWAYLRSTGGFYGNCITIFGKSLSCISQNRLWSVGQKYSPNRLKLRADFEFL